MLNEFCILFSDQGTEFYSCLARQSFTGCKDANGGTVCYCEDDE